MRSIGAFLLSQDLPGLPPGSSSAVDEPSRSTPPYSRWWMMQVLSVSSASFCGVIAPIISHGQFAQQHQQCRNALLRSASIPAASAARADVAQHLTSRRRFRMKGPPVT
eukprot:6295286-Amphidinium_carterae.1